MAELLAANLAALAQLDGALARRVAESAPSPLLEAVTGRAAEPVLRIRSGTGSIQLFSAVNPTREAARRAAAIGAGATVVLLGLGGGHLVRELLERRPTASILAIERDVAALRTILATAPLADALSSGRVRLAVSPADAAAALVAIHQPMIADGIVIEQLEPWVDDPRNAPHFASCRDAVEAAARSLVADLWSYRRFGLRWLAHTVANSFAPAMRRAVPAGYAIGSGTPVVVAAGPSLDDLLDAGGVGDGGTLIAVDTAAPCLAQRGIAIDLIVTIDAQSWSTLHVAGEPSAQLLVADAGVPPAVVRDTRAGRTVFVSGGHPLHALLRASGAALAPLPAGLGVTEQALRIARALGGDPVVLIGADHAAAGLKGYARGTYQTRFALRRTTRTATLETRSAGAVYPAMEPQAGADNAVVPRLSHAAYRAAAARLEAVEREPPLSPTLLAATATDFDPTAFWHTHVAALASVAEALASTGPAATPTVLSRLGPHGIAALPAVAALARRDQLTAGIERGPTQGLCDALAAIRGFVSAQIGRYSEAS